MLMNDIFASIGHIGIGYSYNIPNYNYRKFITLSFMRLN